MTPTRRVFLAGASALALGGLGAWAWSRRPRPAIHSLAGELGLTTGSFTRNLSVEPAAGKLVLIDLPKILRNELDMRVLDLQTATMPSLDADYCDRFRAVAERAGCVITNLKMNQRNLDMASADDSARKAALDTYKRTIDSAHRLGCRWVRPLPGNQRPDLDRLTSAYRELIDYAGPKGITLLIENNGWMRDDPEAIPTVIRRVGAGLAAQPDTGNWTDAARYEGLAKAMPLAASYDFKALRLGPNGEHTDYDLKRCFDIAWNAGFRGPWCFEHFNDDLPAHFKDLAQLRDMLRGWMKTAQNREE